MSFHFKYSLVGEEKKKKMSRCCFICSRFPDLDLKQKRTSFWCEDYRKPLCISPCFKIYYTEVDFKKYGKIYREKGDQLVVEDLKNGDGNEG